MIKHITAGLYIPSEIITSGLSAMIGTVTDVNVTCVNLWGKDLSRELKVRKPSILIVDPMVMDRGLLDGLRTESYSRMKIVALCTVQLPHEMEQCYDATISIYDRVSLISSLLHGTIREEEPERTKELSPREKAVVVGVVKGLSNKEIASDMHVSVNTVMTHRRNIASKLQIHSAAGLTIYAIVSKLVKIDDVKSGITAL